MFSFVAELVTTSLPIVSGNRVSPKENKITYTIVIASGCAAIVVVVVIFIVCWKMLRNRDKKRELCAEDMTTDANLNKKNYIVKYNDSNGSKIISMTSSTTPLIHKSSLRSSFESQWSASFQRRSLQSPAALNAESMSTNALLSRQVLYLSSSNVSHSRGEHFI